MVCGVSEAHELWSKVDLGVTAGSITYYLWALRQIVLFPGASVSVLVILVHDIKN